MEGYTWSYSSLDLFKQCPQKYYRLRVVKDIVEPKTEAIMYGQDLHKAAEDYVKLGTPVPNKYDFIVPMLDRLNKIEGTKLCEEKLGLRYDLTPCGFFDEDVWWRGVADLIIIKDDIAYVIDYKTGKTAKYAKTDQLEILSLAVFKHYPQVKKIKAGLLFVVSKDFVKADYEKSDEGIYWTRWVEDTKQLEGAIKNNVWIKKPNFTCRKFCPIVSCEHNGRTN
jgi:hypothetical protein